MSPSKRKSIAPKLDGSSLLSTPQRSTSEELQKKLEKFRLAKKVALKLEKIKNINI